MGSEKFRGANDWDKFVKETGGGTSNARTDLSCVSCFNLLSGPLTEPFHCFHFASEHNNSTAI